jgi:hypothetical protein
MKNLLENEFLRHYDLLECPVADFVETISSRYFELDDTPAEGLMLHTARGAGAARFSNPDILQPIHIVHYEKFIDQLPHPFRRGRKKCDFILACETDRYVVLGEIKDSPAVRDYRRKVIQQLLSSLQTLVAVPEISVFFSEKSNRRCCYFNRQSKAPEPLNAVAAFNRLPHAFPDGLKMEQADMASLDFEFWEYSGSQTFVIIQ